MKSKKSLWLFLALMLAFGIFLGACSGSQTSNEGSSSNENTEGETTESTEPQDGGDLIVGSTGSPTLFNPLYSTDTASSDIEGFIFDGLVSSDTEFNPTLHLAESINESEDGLTYTVKVKEGVKWHDGEELTADDVVFTYNVPLSPDYNGERGSNFDMIESVTKVDDYTVEFKLKEKNASFYPITLSYYILPEHILGEVPIAELGEHEFNTKNPIGTGAFKFEEWKDGQYVKVVANDDYFLGRPHLDSITYKIVPDMDALLAQLQAGDVHYVPGIPATDVETVQSFSGVKLESGLDLAYTYIGWNQKNEMFQDKKVRQALTMAIDRQSIVDSILNGEGEVAHVPESPLSWAYSDDVTKFDYDPEKAKELLKEAGWEDTDGDGILDKDGKKFSFNIKTNQGNKVREDISVVVQQQLAEIGIEVKPEIIEWSAFIEQVTAPNWNYDAVILGWSLSTFPDQYDIFHSSQMEEGLNFVWWSNEKADQLMVDARKILDRDEFKEAYKEIYSLIADEQPYTFLYYPIGYKALPENLEGFTNHAKDDFYKVNEWWLKQ